MSDHEMWLNFAEQDLSAAAVLVSASLTNPAAYHCQQAAEKALKAFLCFKKTQPPKTHNLIKLVHLCGLHDNAFIKLVDRASLLAPFDTATRYPDDLIAVSGEDCERFVRAARSVVLFVSKKISQAPDDHQHLIFTDFD